MLAAYSLAIFALSGLAASQGSNTTTIHTVTVGYGDLLRFNPEVVNAAVGTQILFQYYPRNHSVAQGSFQSPCSPLDNGFFSGYVPSAAGEAPNSFVITVQDTNPIYYYCSQASHCQAGMIGIINPSTAENTSYAVYNRTAALSTENVTPANGVQGGTLIASAQNVTSSNSSSTVGTSTPTATGAGSASGTSTGSTTGGTTSGTASGTGTTAGSTTGSTPATSSPSSAAVKVLVNGILGGLGMVVGLGMGVL